MKKILPTSIKILNEIEEKFPVEKWKINDIYIWPLLRIDLGFTIYYKRLGEDISRDDSSTNTIFRRATESLKGLVKWGKVIITDPRAKFFFEKAETLFLSDGISYTLFDNKFFERFSDPIIQELKKNNGTIGALNKSAFIIDTLYNLPSPRFSNAKNIQPFIDYILFKSIFSKTKSSAYTKELEGFEEFMEYIDLLKEEYDLQTSFLQNIEKRVVKIEKLILYFEKVLEKTNPKVAFAVCYYSDIAMAFIAACRKKEIKVIDIQHGVQTGDHPAYALWGKIPEKGYNLLPDYFWCWGKDEFQILEKWETEIHQPIRGGNPFVNLWLDDSNPIIKKYDSEIENAEKKPIILLTLQFDLSQMRIISSIIDVMRHTQNEWNWFVRLHPLHIYELEKVRVYLNENGIFNFEIEKSTKLPLYALLRKTQVHITHSSSTVIEAANFGVKSVVTSEVGSEMYSSFIEQNIAYEALDKRKIVLIIDDILNQKKKVNNNLFFSSEDTSQTLTNLFK